MGKPKYGTKEFYSPEGDEELYDLDLDEILWHKDLKVSSKLALAIRILGSDHSDVPLGNHKIREWIDEYFSVREELVFLRRKERGDYIEPERDHLPREQVRHETSEYDIPF